MIKSKESESFSMSKHDEESKFEHLKDEAVLRVGQFRPNEYDNEIEHFGMNKNQESPIDHSQKRNGKSQNKKKKNRF